MAPVCTSRGSRSSRLAFGVLLAALHHGTASWAQQGEVVEAEESAAPSSPAASENENQSERETPPSDDVRANSAPVASVAASATAPQQAGETAPAVNGNPTNVAPVRSATSASMRELIPTAPDPRLRSLDTSFPAEQPEEEEPRVVREVIAPVEVGPATRGPSRRMLLRTINGVTVLTNVDEPSSEPVEDLESVTGRPQYVAANDVARAAAMNAANSLPDTATLTPALQRRTDPDATPSLSGASPWLWGLGSFAAALLVPIAVLLTRPVRRG